MDLFGLCCGDGDARRRENGSSKQDLAIWQFDQRDEHEEEGIDDQQVVAALVDHHAERVAQDRSQHAVEDQARDAGKEDMQVQEEVKIPLDDLLQLEEKVAEYDNHSLLNRRLKERCDSVQKRLDVSMANVDNLCRQYDELLHEKGRLSPKDKNHEGKTFTEDRDDQLELLMEETATSFVPCDTVKASSQAGVACFAKKEYGLASLHFFYARHLARQNADQLAVARSEGNLANVYAALDNPAQALVHVKRALDIVRCERDADLENFILPNAVTCCIKLKRLDEALGYSLRKVVICQNPKEKEEAEVWIENINRAINNEISIEYQEPLTPTVS